MTAKTKLINWAGTKALWVLSILMFPSCQKSASVTTDDGPPESVILDACKKEAGKLWGGGDASEIMRGTPLPSDKRDKSPSGTLIYPVRVVYNQLQEQPFVWDPISKLPRPGDWKAAPVKGEFHFTKNEFNEWRSELIRSGWLSPAPGPVINDPGNRPAFYEAYKKADIDQLKSLLRDSQSADHKNGVTMSTETKLRQFWLESARDAVGDEIAREEEEAERLYSFRGHDSWLGYGRSIDEIMFLREWKHPQAARAAMEREKSKEEAGLNNDPDALVRYRSDFETARAERAQRMREEIEYQRQRAHDPERFPAEHRHYFAPGEVEAWQKALGSASSGVSRNTEPVERAKPAVNQSTKEQVARAQGGSDVSGKHTSGGQPQSSVGLADVVDSVDALAEKAADGDADAQFGLSRCYFLGEKTSKDLAKAIVLLRKAADQGHSKAQYALGHCFVRGEGVVRDYSEAVRWFKKSAEQGNAGAQRALGQSYFEGLGVEKSIPEAVDWFRKSSEQGDAVAQYALGLCYRRGQGVPQDDVEAAKWFRKSAEQGYVEAQSTLGQLYLQGKGVPKDEGQAIAWIKKSAEQGHEFSEYTLGVCYGDGIGVRCNGFLDRLLVS